MITEVEIEFSRKWMAENFELFTRDMLVFVEQYPAGCWTYSLRVAGDRYILTATLKKQ